MAPVISENAEVINALPAAHIGKLNDAIDKVKGIVGTADSAVQGLNEIMPYLPQMLGADGQTRNYLLMAQTNSEIHATGGHPGAVGIISITDGVLEKGDFVPPMSVMESYDSPVYANEEEIALFNNIGKVPTSSNCTPDFSRAGYIFGEMWKDQVGDDIDGVIAVDPLFLQALMKHVGGFTASNGIQVSGDNVARLLLHDIYLDVPIEETDDFFSEVASTSFELVLWQAGFRSVSPTCLKRCSPLSRTAISRCSSTTRTRKPSWSSSGVRACSTATRRRPRWACSPRMRPHPRSLGTSR